MQQMAQAAGFACPECNNKIPVNYFEMVSTGKISCHVCGLELLLNREKSANALNIVDKAISGVEAAKSHADKHSLNESTQPKRGRGRQRQQRQSRVSRR